MEQIIGEIEKTETKKTIFSIREFKGNSYLDIRDHFKTKKMDKWQPTKSGIMFKLNNVPDVVSMSEKAEDAINNMKGDK